jgi:hypothetical protein
MVDVATQGFDSDDCKKAIEIINKLVGSRDEAEIVTGYLEDYIRAEDDFYDHFNEIENIMLEHDIDLDQAFTTALANYVLTVTGGGLQVPRPMVERPKEIAPKDPPKDFVYEVFQDISEIRDQVVFWGWHSHSDQDPKLFRKDPDGFISLYDKSGIWAKVKMDDYPVGPFWEYIGDSTMPMYTEFGNWDIVPFNIVVRDRSGVEWRKWIDEYGEDFSAYASWQDGVSKWHEVHTEANHPPGWAPYKYVRLHVETPEN